MAARNSCTKLTWGDAKNKCGVGKNKAGNKIQQRETHGKLLAAKIISKGGPDTDTKIKNRQAAKIAKKDQKLQEELNRQHEIKKEQQRLEDFVRPNEKAMEKMKEIELDFHQRNNSNNNSNNDSNNHIKDCTTTNILALHAIYDDTETIKISDASNLDELQIKLDDWQNDPDQKILQQSVIDHPIIMFTMKRKVTPPKIQITWFTLTKKSLITSSNKPLESLGVLDEIKLIQSMSDYAQEFLLGMPSVYELLDTWLSEHLFEYIDCPSRQK
ncbi:hypothetical protein FRACYDRAFT_249131 [Fragilariopsis cylindrus CCMP1102]|uniref:Uncharacterized protein n=1 Tax=Fragilariopsis cylindrus CCMP1102 TaxID=635003 RepID=A0A1E7ESE6_9STRA|nr:hypothetical protein FRACYDRAFT_249131 [Fragilariopsis cylindrus CCMP1102]|eukprot:OEU08789.1 hypothetical protein FRACYDRAFT_249131 [Fragilariopsis cylindrus CCMP1102]